MTGTSVTNPLAAAIALAGKLPTTTGATARARERRDAPVVVLADVSSSMAEHAGARRKIDILQDALAALDAPAIIAFASQAHALAAGARLPEPYGGTAMHLAFDVANQSGAKRLVVISDGIPDDRTKAFAAADQTGATIDVIYCGPDDDREAIAFMTALATRAGGRMASRNLSRAPDSLAATLRQFALPAPVRAL